VGTLSLAVEAISLTKQFGQVRALDGVSFNIKPGEIYGLIGPNGAGKTTTLRTIFTLIKPTSGTIKIFGQDATIHPEKTRQIISYLPEESGAYPNLTGLEYLTFMAKLQSTPTQT
jgi:ABC-2 type transport system ATP-binding protein